MIRAVVDTNLIISGLFWRGNPAQVYDSAAKGIYVLLTTTDLIDELDRVLRYPKFAARLASIGKTANTIVTEYRAITELVTSAEIPPDAIRDPKDIPVLACAVGGKADYIVSGDQDLLVLTAYQNIPILDTAQFVKRLEE